MAIPDLVTTVGSDSANSYRSLTEAEDYFDARPNSDAWTNAETPEKQKALLAACRRLSGFDYVGYRATTTQKLPWPRIDAPKRDGAAEYFAIDSTLNYGETYSETEIPEEIKDAQCEIALEYLDGWTEGREASIKRFTDDKMSVEYDQPTQRGELPPRINQLLAGLIRPGRRIRG